MLLRLHWLVQSHVKSILVYWITSHASTRGNEEVDAATNTDLLRRITNISIPHGDFKNINDLLKCKWQPELGEAAQQIACKTLSAGSVPQVFRIIRLRVLARIQIGHSHLTHTF